MKKCLMVISCLCGLLLSQSAISTPKARIAIIIDDIGYQYKREKALIDTPAALTYAVLPDAPYAKRLANYANAKGKEIMLHIPMQGTKEYLSEPQSLNDSMEEGAFKAQVKSLLQQIPHITGVNNHMGSVLTRNNKQMTWLMESIVESEKNLFFIDSLTTGKSVARYVALSYDIPTLVRDIFLDSVANEEHIQKSFNKLIATAQRKGRAIAIAHPYPETIAVLNRNLKTLEKHNIELVPVSEMVNFIPRISQK